MSIFQLGISSYTFMWAIGVSGYPPPARPLDAFGLLDSAVALGVNVVQIADNLALDRLSSDDLRFLKQAADERAVQVEVGTRGIQPEPLLHNLAIAQQFGSPVLRAVIDTADHQPSVDDVIALLRRQMPRFAHAGVILALENHDRFSVADFVRILESVDSPNLGICLDTVNSFGALEGPQVVVDALGPWTVNLHVKDFIVRRADHAMGFAIEGAPAGQGRLDIPWLLAELAQHGHNMSAILELWPPPEASVEETIVKETAWAQQSIDYLRTIIR